MTACPASRELQELLAGELAPDRTSLIRRHVNGCATCQAWMESHTGDLWTGLAGGSARTTVAEPGATVRALIAGLAERPPELQQTPPDAPIRFPGPPDGAAPLGRLGCYAIRERIADGAQGILFRAWDETLQRMVALKVLRDAGAVLDAPERFEREARAAAGLDDPRIVRVYQVLREPGFAPCMVLEFVAGGSLRDRLAGNRPEFRLAVQWLRDAALGLQAAHQAGLVHRDIKPSNILLDARNGLARLTDFGLVRESRDSARLTQEGVLAGTPAYMSPEQIADPSTVDARADIYSLGVVMYELLTGEIPFQGTVRMTLLQVATGDPRPPRTLNERIPRDLETVCLRAMARDRESRFQSAAGFAAELDR